MFKKILLFCIILFNSQYLMAQIVDTYDFHNDNERQRAITLAKSLRCPQCQNQNLVESNSPIATDLRLEVYNMVNAGKTNSQIIQEMTNRFGDFVLYDPPFKSTTFLLWALPLGIILIAILWFIYHFKNKRLISTTTPNMHTASSMKETLPHSLCNITVPPKSILPQKNYLFSIVILFIISISLTFYAMSHRFSQWQVSQVSMQNKQQELQSTTLQQHQLQQINDVQNHLRKDKNNPEQWIKLGQLYMQLEQYNNALIAFSYAERLTDEKAPVLGLAATALYYQNQQHFNPKINELINAALKQDPDEISSLSLKANHAFLQKDYPQAIHLWKEMLDSQKPNIDRKAIIERINTAKFLNKKI